MIKLLQGVRVVECAVLPTGDTTGRLLGDLGADVIKIEQPGVGDYLRELGGRLGGQPHQSPFHLMCNRNKRSLTLNLRSEEGRSIFWELLATADIFIDGFANDACDKLGVGYDEQVKVNPDIVYCQSNGFGVKGPYGPIPVHGYMMGGVAGALPLGEDEDGLVRQVQPAVDSYFAGQLDGPTVGAVWAVVTALAGLQYRNSSGNGVYIDNSGSDSIAATQWIDNTINWNTGRIEKARNNAPPSQTDPRKRPKYTFYKTKDEKYVMLAAIEHKFWDNFCRAIDRDDLRDVKDTSVLVDFQVQDDGRTDLIDVLKEVFLNRTQAEWVQAAVEFDIPLSPANQRGDLVDDPHMRARDIIDESVHPTAGPFTTIGWPAVIRDQHYETHQHAPALGQHTAELLAELGHSAEELAKLQERGVV
jgi:crotonobetainyl-CoA:carnitine CoA-transferase CaiB-like acyl-CoA transferase